MTKIGSYHDKRDGRHFTPGNGVNSLARLLLGPIFLMTKPTHYDPNPALRIEKMGVHDNEKTARSDYRNFSPDQANMQHQRLREAKHDLGASIVLDDGHPDHFDGVYSADPSITFMHLKIDKGQIRGVHFETIASYFYNHSRDGEVERQIGGIQFLKRYLAEKFGLSVTSEVYTASIHGEGTGDNVYDPHRDLFFSGYKPKTGEFKPTQGRSDPEFHTKILQGRVQIPTFGFEVYNGFFHADTVVGPTSSGDVVAYPTGMSENDFSRLQSMIAAEGKQLIIVDENDAHKYAPNLTIIGAQDIITSTTSAGFKDALEDAGYRNHQVNLDQYVQQSGGGAHCLGNRIILRRDELREAMRLLSYEI